MATTRVEAPDGTSYDVVVEWFPRHRRLASRFAAWRRDRRRDDEAAWWDVVPPLGVEVLAGAVVAVAVLAVVVLGWFVLVPLLLLLVDVVLVVVLLLAGLVARVGLRRPWKVTVTRVGAGEATSVGVVGLRAARAVRDAVADGLRDGSTVADALRAAC